MVRKIFLLFVIFIITNCIGTYSFKTNRNNEVLVNDFRDYSFQIRPSIEDLKKIDTTAYYIQIFPENYINEDLLKNPQIFIFHNDGFYKRESLKYFGNRDKYRNKNSIYYGGKYKIIGDEVFLESFGKYPGAKKWYKNITKGKILGDSLYFDEYTIFVKKYSIY